MDVGHESGGCANGQASKKPREPLPVMLAQHTQQPCLSQSFHTQEMALAAGFDRRGAPFPQGGIAGFQTAALSEIRMGAQLIGVEKDP
jgi:hypothetical protein